MERALKAKISTNSNYIPEKALSVCEYYTRAIYTCKSVRSIKYSQLSKE